jgi:hypothetical protein
MENYQNIEQTKEYQLAKEVEGGLNDYSFNAKNFAAAIPMMHPTLQQSFYRLIREWQTTAAVMMTVTVLPTKMQKQCWNTSRRKDNQYHLFNSKYFQLWTKSMFCK